MRLHAVLFIGLIGCNAAPEQSQQPPASAGPSHPPKPTLVQLPEHDDYARAKPSHAWGRPCAVHGLVDALTRFRANSGYAGELIVLDMSARGGDTAPHRTHREGLDVDLRVPTSKPYPWRDRPPLHAELDWVATWQLLLALEDTPGVAFVRWHEVYQRYLHEAVVDGAASSVELERVLHRSRVGGGDAGFLRHGEGMSHLHVHFTCGPGDVETREKNGIESYATRTSSARP